jgi:hypothetical protein
MPRGSLAKGSADVGADVVVILLNREAGVLLNPMMDNLIGKCECVSNKREGGNE